YHQHGDNPYYEDNYARHIATLTERGWDIRQVWGVVYGDNLIRAVSTPEYPLRPPDQPVGPIEEIRARWPEHAYRYSDGLWAALDAAEQRRPSQRWTWRKKRNPSQGSGSPAYLGEPIPTGEDVRARLIRWAGKNLHDDVITAAVPGSIDLVML
ncbi:MAG: hypothetical protein ACRDJU_02285, partial [Actinomycetota bacterium]